MAGGLHGLDMIKQLRNNENLRKKDYFKKSATSTQAGTPTSDATEPALTQVERNQLIEKIRDAGIQEKKRALTALLISTGIVVILIILITIMFRV
jgi:hypothetical protein